MKISRHFAGDTYEPLQRVQEEVYPNEVGRLYESCYRSYMAAADASTPQDNKLFDAIRGKTTCEDRIIQPAYDRIAAWFRFTHADAWQIRLFPGAESDADDTLSHEQKLRRDWLAFYHQECEAITENDEMVRAVLNAVAFEGEDRGDDARSAFLWLLDKKYKRLTYARERWRYLCESRGARPS